MRVEDSAEYPYAQKFAQRGQAMSKPAETYIGKRSCGCVVWILSSALKPIEASKEIMKASRQGLEVSLVPTQEAIDSFCSGIDCTHGGKK
jgi:hypothetical protein